MKRVGLVVGFGLLGGIFALLIQDAVTHFLDHNVYESGSDEAGEPYLKNLVIGVPLFAIIWGWVGSTLARNWRQGAVMLGGIGLATLVCFGVPGLRGPLAGVFSFSGRGLGIVAWGLVSAMFALVGRIYAGRLRG